MKKEQLIEMGRRTGKQEMVFQTITGKDLEHIFKVYLEFMEKEISKSILGYVP